jgi:hypothetical protein
VGSEYNFAICKLIYGCMSGCWLVCCIYIVQYWGGDDTLKDVSKYGGWVGKFRAYFGDEMSVFRYDLKKKVKR